MTTFEQIDAPLAAQGWHYDPDDETFRHGKWELDYQKVLALVPGLILDELASYQDDQYDKLRAKRAKAN